MDDVLCALRARVLTACRRFGRLSLLSSSARRPCRQRLKPPTAPRNAIHCLALRKPLVPYPELVDTRRFRGAASPASKTRGTPRHRATTYSRGRGPGDSRPRPPAPRREAAQTPGGVKLLCPQGTINPVQAANPRPTKNGAAGEFRRAVARALQEGTRARTSGGAARRGSDVGGRQPDPGSPRLPDVRARRLLTQRSRRADADNASGCRFRTRSGTSRTRRAPCSSRRAGCCSSRPGTWYRCRIPGPGRPCRRRNPWSGCPVPPWCPCR